MIAHETRHAKEVMGAKLTGIPSVAYREGSDAGHDLRGPHVLLLSTQARLRLRVSNILERRGGGPALIDEVAAQAFPCMHAVSRCRFRRICCSSGLFSAQMNTE